MSIAYELSEQGKIFSKDLRDNNRGYFKNLPYSYFAIASAISLTWTRHALYEQEFINYAAGFIDGVNAYEADMSTKFSYRFGVEGLEVALKNYRTYYNRSRDLMIDFDSCNTHQLSRLQTKLLNRLDTLRKGNLVTAIGPWLFTGPFKIILSDKDSLWDNDGLNAIVLPTGMEVDRGIERLIAEDYSFVRDFDVNWLKQSSNSLLDSYGTYNIVHTFISNIGKLTDTPAIHINSALYLYGKGDI